MCKLTKILYCTMAIFLLAFEILPGKVSVAYAASNTVVISQIYGGGGNSGATLKNDFIELFNSGTSDVNINNWSIQYAPGGGSTWLKTNLSGSLKAGHYYLIQQAAGAGGTQDLPTPDAVGNINLNAVSGKVALITNQTLMTCGVTTNDCFPNAAIMDFVGYGNANNYEGTGTVGALNNTTAALRVENGCIDTDNNRDKKVFDNGIWWIAKAGDFMLNIHHPRNSTFPMNPCQNEMATFVNGTAMSKTHLLKFGHKSKNEWPEIAAIYNTGFIRLVPPGLVYGTSFVLGPGYWDDGDNHFHNVQLLRVDIDTSGANPSGSLQLTITARDYYWEYWPAYRMRITYTITLFDPTAISTKMSVKESYTVASGFNLSSTRQGEHQGFKWVQFSSMYVDNHFHDSDGAQYFDAQGMERISNFGDFYPVGCGEFVFSSPHPMNLASPWMQVRHSDDLGWQGNTPNTIVQVNNPTQAGQITPQGFVNDVGMHNCITDPNEDNIGVWLNNDAAPLTFNAGMKGSIQYILISQDNPRESQQFHSAGSDDGWVLESSETSTQGGAVNASATTLVLGDTAQDRQYRGILSFDTTSIPDNAKITSVKLKVKSAGVVGTNPFATHNGLKVDVRAPFFGPTLGLNLSDFQAMAACNTAGAFGNTPSGGWYTATLNPSKFACISLTSATQFRLQFEKDDNDNLIADYIKFHSGNINNINVQPVLIVEYYIP